MSLFPYPKIRKVQKAMMKYAESSLNNWVHLLVHAPTGIGKTAATIPPALEFAIKNDKIVFFLTPKHTQHTIAIETLKMIKEKYNLSFVAVDFIGKKWMCLLPGVTALTPSEFSEYCKEMRENGNCEYYTKIYKNKKLSAESKILLKDLEEKSPINVDEMIKICKKKKLCPYEISCQLAKKATVFIADYYHILNPSIRENLLRKIDKRLKDCILIFDEAHSLPERARELLSISISTITIERAKKEAKIFGFEEICNKLEFVKDRILGLAKKKLELDKEEEILKKEEFFEELGDVYSEYFIKDLRFLGELVLEKRRRSYSNSVANFLEAWIGPDVGFVRLISRCFTKNGKPYISIVYKCLDPSFVFKPLIEESLVIAMSGTLTPTTMYKDLLGFENAITAEFNNPFPKKNRINIVFPETTTKYKTRGEEMYKEIAKRCAEIANATPGNVAFFFPSYEVKDNVYEYFKDICQKTIFIEESKMNKFEKEMLLKNFKAYKETGAVLFGVISGNFSEGIDFPGDFLNGVVIVGLPLSKPNLETKELIRYYNKKFGDKGLDYAYVYPAMIRCMQGAGRCIRSSKDRGVIVFLDERYIWKKYYQCFPPDWEMKITRNPLKMIEEFFYK